MKLYFNSFNNSVFESAEALEKIIEQDLSTRLGEGALIVRIKPLNKLDEERLLPRLIGINLDDLDIECDTYHANPAFLKTEPQIAEETLCSDLLKSNCLVTDQPDWCSLQITYQGYKINREGLLQYIVSFRNDNEFHEQCVEKVFMHLMQYCKPRHLTVYGRSTRRGGIDINSIRSTQPIELNMLSNLRLCRQ